jgi:hypothetical protein
MVDHLAVRLHVLTGALPVDVLAPGQDWPALYSNLDELLAHRAGGSDRAIGLSTSASSHDRQG